MKKQIIFIIFFLVAFLSFSQNTGIISGKVIDKKTKQPLVSAEIFVVQSSYGTVTNIDGDFKIVNLPSGIYTLQCKLMGYVPQKKQIKVESGQTSKINFELVKQSVKLDEVVILKKKGVPSLKAHGVPVTTINREAIEFSNKSNMSEVLMKIPGIYMEPTGNTERTNIFIRGIGADGWRTPGILILIDGMPITDAMGDTYFESIDMENIEKIEVIKGPVSALYGSNAMSGVINIFLKEPINGFHGKLKQTIGQFHTNKTYGNINGTKNGYGFYISADHSYTDGYQDNAFYESTHANFKLNKAYEGIGKFSLLGEYSNSDRGLTSSLDSLTFVTNPTYNDRNNHYVKTFYNTSLSYNNVFSNNLILYSIGYLRFTQNDGSWSDTRWSEDDITSTGGELRLTKAMNFLNVKNTITFGGSYAYETSEGKDYERDAVTKIIGEQTDEDKVNYSVTGLYIQDQIDFTKKLKMTLGLHYESVYYDWNDVWNYGTPDDTSNTTTISDLTPKAGISYEFNQKLTVFANAGQGFNPPSYYNLFIDGYTTMANPDLRPEYLTSYDFGIKGLLINKTLEYQFSYYHIDYYDKIDAVLYEPDPNYEIYENVGDTRNKGFEASLNYKPNDKLYFYGTYNYLDARFTYNPDEDLIGNRLRKSPYHQYSFGGMFSLNKIWSVTSDFIHVGEYEMSNGNIMSYDGYNVVNMKLLFKQNNWTVTWTVNNVLDEKYATFAYYSDSRGGQYYRPGLPRNYSFSVSYKF